MTDLEQQLTDHLRRRAAAAIPRYDLEGVEQATSRTSLVDLDDHRPRRPTTRTIVGLVAVAAAAAVAIAVVTIPADEPTVSTSVLATDDGPTFAAAIEASGLLTSPSTDEADQARDESLYRPTGQAEASAAGHRVSLRSCQPWAASTCGTGFAYVTRTAGGLLGEASDLGLQLLDDRYFVASESFVQTSPGVVEAPSRAWLIDASTGEAGSLSWRDEPTTITSPAQALLWWVDTPHVVDARDGTIRPLAVPDDVLTPSFLPQLGTGRIWLRTDPAGDGFGLASSDDGGATWSGVALPGLPPVDIEDGITAAAAGDRVAVTSGWVPDGMPVYVSTDAGRSWTAVTPPSDPEGRSNIATLDVLADGRLELRLMMDRHLQERFVSTDADWAELEEVDNPSGPTTLAKGEDVEVVGWSELAGRTLNIDAVEVDGEVTGEFRVNNVVVTIQCAATRTSTGSDDGGRHDGRDLILGGVVTDDPDGQGLLYSAFDADKLAVGDLVALIIREGDEGDPDRDRVTLYADDSLPPRPEDPRPPAGSCTELVETVPGNLDGGYFNLVVVGDDIEIG